MWFGSYGNGSIGRITATVTPKISSVSSASRPAGTTLTITGQNHPAAITRLNRPSR